MDKISTNIKNKDFTFNTKNYNILIIEDSKSINKILNVTFSKLGYNCYSAYTLEDGKSIINDIKIDYIMLDVNLPDGSGYELIKSLSNSHEKIFVLTNETDKQFKEVAYQKGIIDFIEKDKAFFNKISQIPNSIEQLEKNITKTILVIDDSFVVREQISDTFTNRNYNVKAVSGTKQALDYMDDNKVDLILLDVELENENGIDFLLKQKINIIDKLRIPVLIVSGFVDSNITREALKAGAKDVIKKPYVIEEIVSKVDMWIDYKRKDDEIKETEQLLQEYKNTVDRSAIVSKTNPKGQITYINQKFCDISGYTKDELIGRSHNIVRHPDMEKEAFENLWYTIQVLKKPWFGKVKNKKKDGTAYWVDTVINPILDDKNRIIEYIAIRTDITDMVNPRKTLLDKISHSKAPFLMIAKIADWDVLKEFYGEKVIEDIEEKFGNCIMNFLPDNCIFEKVYKLDNGEFAFFKDFEKYDDKLAPKIEERLKEFQSNIKKDIIDFGIGKFNINVIVSFGLEKDDLFESVELGLQKAIADKKSILFANGISKRAKTKAKNNLKTINMIKTAVETNNIISYFQPIIDNKTQEVTKYESLVRLVNEDGSIISPYFFIDMSKKCAYYSQITNIVIDNTFNALRYTDKQISLNLSALDIENVEIRNKLINLISIPENYGRLMFELLEDEVIHDFRQIKDFIDFAKVVGGVTIAIDDFGAGYSNFERILDFKPDILKIDGSLIKNIATDKFSLDVVETIVAFAKKQNIKITAEFVECKEIFDILQKLEIDFSQGYYFGKPQKKMER